MNTALHCAHQRLPLPLLFVCEDNGLGISVRTPAGWVQSAYGSRPHLRYEFVDGTDPLAVLRRHPRAGRLGAHACAGRRSCTCGPCASAATPAPTSSPRTASAAELRADAALDPIVATAAQLVAGRARSVDSLLARHDELRDARVRRGRPRRPNARSSPPPPR